MTDLFDDLEDPSKETTRATPQERFPCTNCAGTGLYQADFGPRKCFPCNGRGYFLQSPEKRRKARAQRRASQVQALADRRSEFHKENPGLIEFLTKSSTWNNFAASLLQSFAKYGSLTEKQLLAVHRMQAKAEARAQERKSAPTLDVGSIRAMFDKAIDSGLAIPKYRANDLTIHLASSAGRNPGALYVKHLNNYVGKIIENSFHPIRNCPPVVLETLEEIAKDPEVAAANWGHKTGSCSFCGRTLTDPKSIALGIGPICATRWGLTPRDGLYPNPSHPENNEDLL